MIERNDKGLPVLVRWLGREYFVSVSTGLVFNYAEYRAFVAAAP